jgi:Domain of unknown function (DUF6970)
MKLIIAIILGLYLFSGCQKDNNTGKEVPLCISAKIDTFKNHSCAIGASVKQYTFNGETVFVFDPGGCGADMSADVEDAACTNLGFLGGFNGNTKIQGVEFSTAVYIRTIWSR